jgi:polysaccharide biosynthesis transport protein
MSGQLVPLDTTGSSSIAPAALAPLQHWGPPAAPPPAQGNQFARYVAALKRFKWFILGAAILGTALGVLATRFIKPLYETRATVFISASAPLDDNKKGPIRADGLLSDESWVQLLQSFKISDAVVTKLRLYITPTHLADTTALAGLTTTPQLRPGNYTVRVDGAGVRYQLLDDRNAVIEQGALGDSVGRRVGFLWQPTARDLPAGKSVVFEVVNPRDASLKLATSLRASRPQNTNFLNISLRGKDPQLTARALNAWIEEFVRVAADLKKQNLVEFAKILDGQLQYSEQSLANAERALETFKVNTITLPQEGLAMAPGGLQITQDPVMQSFFAQKTAYDDLHRDRATLESLVRGPRPISTDALLSIPSVAAGEAGANLRNAVNELLAEQAKLRSMRQFYEEQYQGVKDEVARIQTLQSSTIPSLASGYLSLLRSREGELNSRISSSSADIRGIPKRTIDAARLQREVEVNEKLYGTLKSRYEDAKLAEASAVPDVRILDPAVAPLLPTNNTTPKVILGGLAGGIGLGLILALLLDRMDRRFRYPDQATTELGLDIVGAIPTLPRNDANAEGAAQLVEAFRSLRLHLRHEFPAHQTMELTVTSPGTGDGKSFVSSNLAASLGEGGMRVLLIDGDVRRGELHTTFGVEQSPGLLDYLAGRAGPADIVYETAHQNVMLMPCGTRLRRGPELLGSPALQELLVGLRSQYDAIIIDSAPLGAGSDAYALGTATRNMLLVLRAGRTDRKLAQAKLEMADRLPLRLLGAVLNCIKAEGIYKYYSYLDGYSVDMSEEEDGPETSVVRSATERA